MLTRISEDKSPYKPDGYQDEIFCDIGAMSKEIFFMGTQAQLEADREKVRELFEKIKSIFHFAYTKGDLADKKLQELEKELLE